MQNPFSLPRDERMLEDYPVGLVLETDGIVISEDEIITFAKRYDPQYFHVDPGLARASQFGGLIASGWNTVGIMMRQLVDHFLPGTNGLASPGVDEVRFLAPVRPGDRLRIRVTVTEVRRSASKPDRGLMRSDVTVLNQDDTAVLSMKTMTLMRARAGGL